MSHSPVHPQLRLYFENPVGRLLEHPDGYLVVQYNAGKRKLEELKTFLTQASTLLQQRNWHKLLGDQRVMAAFTEAERVWITENWLTRSTTAHPYYGAVLLAHDVFARLAMNLVMNEARESGLVYRLFEDENAAVAWLLQVP
ncbi:hypothetical protein MUN84_17505 [Hymenobacter sp. 5516J-16]|uniref:STAS/SEC14 domain-containing protein n=1 Tax=Hymenobacter sublimis TaxID=2933777 RepID=A0ABY4JDL0_9BACT|nr:MULTISPECIES: hypothetical protein [Hymenobacter]UOQ76347.1 hypothetical protein MUN84_17505 [Hymenobacter sp. 5516J-16]UPL50014.1 hypothetical protein MWH26_03665 [Hymenobacter sublimis]